MLLINGEMLNINSKSAVASQISKYKKELEKIGYPITFKFPQKYFRKLKSGETQSPCAKRLATKINFNGDRGAEEIIYCKRFWNDSNENLVTYPNKIVLNQFLVVEEKDWDLAVYLNYFYPHKDRSYVLFDPKAIERKRHEQELRETKVRAYIHTPDMMGLKDNQVKSLALAYGIIDQEMATLKNRLWDAVKMQEGKTKDGFADFLDLVEKKELLNMRANVQKAIALDIIRKFEDKAKTWAYPNEKGGVGSAIMKYVNPEAAFGELIAHFSTEAKDYEALLSVLGKDAIAI